MAVAHQWQLRNVRNQGIIALLTADINFMRLAYLLVAACGITNFLSLVVWRIAPSILMPLLFGFLFCMLVVAILATLLVGAVHWRKFSRWWMGPAALAIALSLAIPTCGQLGVWSFLDHWRLQHHMAAYAKVIESIHVGIIPCQSIEPDSREQDGQRDTRRLFSDHNVADLPPYTISIQADCCRDGSVRVVFLDKGSSAVGHAGYLYKDYSEASNCASEFAKREQKWGLWQVTGNWYRFSD